MAPLPGFQSARTIKDKPRLIVCVEGMPKHGKSNFSLTAPGPIAILDFDFGLAEILHKFSDKEIQVCPQKSAAFYGSDAVTDWVEQLRKTKAAWTAALNSKDVRTVTVDTTTELWELLRMARLGKLTQVMPVHYGPVNAEMRGFIREALESDKNVIFTHKMTAKYVNDVWSGDYARAGFKDMGYLAQVCVRLTRDDDEDVAPLDRFGLEVLDCRQNPEINGMKLEGEMVSFPLLASLVYPDVDAENWQ